MTSRVAFVLNEYRYTGDSRPAIRSQYRNARVRVLNTNLDLAGAVRRVDEELAGGAATLVFEVTVQHIFLPDDFAGAPPQFAIYSPDDGLTGEVFRAMDARVDLLTGRTTLQVRG